MTATLQPGALCTVDDAVAYISGSVPDDQINKLVGMINAASDLIQRFSFREFAPTEDDADRVLEYRGGRDLRLAPYDAREITSVTIDGVELDTDRYLPRPLSKIDGVYKSIRLAHHQTICLEPFGVVPVTVHGDWGFPAIPPRVERACLRLVDAWYAIDGPAFTLEYGDIESGPTAPPVPVDVWAVINSYRGSWV